MTVATNDAFRNITVVQPTTPEPTVTTVAAETVGDTLTITAGLGITITADPNSDSIIITNTGNGTGAYTEIADSDANVTFYPLFSRPLLPTDINNLDTPPSYQLDAIYVDNTTTPMTYNPSTGTLTTLVVSANIIGNVTGNADTVTNGVYTNGSYSDPSWLTISQTKVGLSNVTNESKATMFSSPTFTGTVSGVTATMVGLGNVTNESKATMFSSPTFTGTVSGITSAMVGLGNVTNESKATMFASPTFTGTVSGVTATMVGLGNVTNESKATMFSSPTFTGTVSGVTSAMVGLGNVENTALSTSTHYIGTTSIQYNRASASQTLTGVSIDGNAGTVTNGVVTTGSYSDPSWLTISSTKVGLGNVENTALSTSTHYIGTTSIQYNRASASQTLTGVSIDGNAGTVTNGVYTNGSYANPTWITSLAASKVGLGNVENTALSTWAGSSNITTVGTLGSLTVTNNIATTAGLFSAPLATKTSTGTGTAGQVAWDANYIYICTATNTWKRVALTAGVF